jgi:hypothetical protein
MDFKYYFFENQKSNINTIKCNFISDDINYNYNLDLEKYDVKLNEEVDNIIELMKCEENLKKIDFNYNYNKLVIKNGKFNFGNGFSIKIKKCL